MHNREAATSRDPTSLGDIRVPQHETPAGHLVIHIRSDAPRAINRKLPTGGDTRGSSPATHRHATGWATAGLAPAGGARDRRGLCRQAAASSVPSRPVVEPSTPRGQKQVSTNLHQGQPQTRQAPATSDRLMANCHAPDESRSRSRLAGSASRAACTGSAALQQQAVTVQAASSPGGRTT